MASFTVLEFQNLLKIGPEFTCVKSKLLLFGTLVVSFIIFILQKKKKVENISRPENQCTLR